MEPLLTRRPLTRLRIYRCSNSGEPIRSVTNSETYATGAPGVCADLGSNAADTVVGGGDEAAGGPELTTLSNTERLELERSMGTVNCVSFAATASLLASSVPLSKFGHLMLVPLMRFVASALAKFSRAIIAPLESHCSARSE